MEKCVLWSNRESKIESGRTGALCRKVWLLTTEQAGGLNMHNGLAPAVVALRAEERAFLLQ